MNREETIAAIKVMQAYVDGAEIESREVGESSWHSWKTPSWDFPCKEYRIKPKPLEFWVNKYPDGSDGGSTYKSRDAAAQGAIRSLAVQVLMREVTE